MYAVSVISLDVCFFFFIRIFFFVSFFFLSLFSIESLLYLNLFMSRVYSSHWKYQLYVDIYRKKANWTIENVDPKVRDYHHFYKHSPRKFNHFICCIICIIHNFVHFHWIRFVAEKREKEKKGRRNKAFIHLFGSDVMSRVNNDSFECFYQPQFIWTAIANDS